MAGINCCNNTTNSREPLIKVLDRFFAEPFAVAAPVAAVARAEAGYLPVDVSETDTQVIVRASAPGFRKGEVEAEIHDHVLTIKAEHKEEREESGERFFRKELRQSAMSRRIAMPTEVVAGEVAAELRDGILTLRIPKAPQATPRKIKID